MLAIKSEHLNKKYILKHRDKEPYHALRDVIARSIRQAGKSLVGIKVSNPSREEFYALKDVSFEINEGDRFGIIGRNGAGKSTLLKIISRITQPTSGKVSIKGRVASLLEVGTGFHPELSGRENIFLNGSVLGMTRAEIKNKFDEIVSFSGVERFLDTPVKRYSSGMYVRLAFAVAAHLEPEILVVDEVLAVGDAEFQKKCLGKMKDVASGGRTVLFVSHNMAAVQNLCNKALYLKEGKLEMTGEKDAVISEYLRSTVDSSRADLRDRKDRKGNGIVRFRSVTLRDEKENVVNSLQSGSGGFICLGIEFRNPGEQAGPLHVSMGIDDDLGQRITHFNTETSGTVFPAVNGESAEVWIHIPRLPLKHGNYTFTLYCTHAGEISDWIMNAGSFHVEPGDYFGTGKLLPEGQGKFYVEHSFQLKNIS